MTVRRIGPESARTAGRVAAVAAGLILVVPLLAAPASADARGLDRACPVSAVPPAPFDDTAGTTFGREIDCMYEVDVVRGSGGTFVPDGSLTRGQAMSLLFRLSYVGRDKPAVADAADRFDDDNGSVHESAINFMASRGIAAGYGDRKFRPDDPVRRDQFAAFLLRLHEADGYRAPQGGDRFDDVDGNVHQQAVEALAELGVVTGTGPRAFGPAGLVRRGQAAAFSARLADAQVEQSRPWPLPANQLFTVDPPREQFRELSAQPRAIDLTVSGLTAGRTYEVVVATVESVSGQPPDRGAVQFADTDGNGQADLPAPRARIVAVAGSAVTPTAATRGTADSAGRLRVTVDNEHPSGAVLVVYEPNSAAPGLQTARDGTARQPFGASGDLQWFVRGSHAPLRR